MGSIRTELNQAGLAETIATSLSALPQDLQGMFWNNIVCVGGSVGFEGFGQRLLVFYLSPILTSMH